MGDDSVMLYELEAQQLGFLFKIRHDSGQPFNVHVEMKPYSNRDMIRLLKEKLGHMQQAKDDIDAWDIKEGNPLAAQEFFNKHVIAVKLNNKALDEDQIEKLDSRWGIKSITIDHGYNGIYRVPPSVEEEMGELDVDSILGDSTVWMKFLLTDAEEKECEILIPHVFDYPTAMDSLTWDRAQIQQGMRHGGFRIQYNHEALNTLYNKKIQSVWDSEQETGIVLNGNPCIKENKEEWADRVPYLMKRAALSFLFSRAERATRGNL